ncbi:MAG TPA: hypothetical protein VJ772_04210 [Nitrososphaeraceae archaeon]|nr:hypothetical protein [Nitrososphaeraceae archaeon]
MTDITSPLGIYILNKDIGGSENLVIAFTTKHSSKFLSSMRSMLELFLMMMTIWNYS